MSPERYAACIEACYRCARACDHCATACLREDEAKSLADCVALDLDCADVCRLAAAAMARNSDYVQAICELCAGLCDACGRECGRHDHEHCRACATACERCAEECRRV